MEDCASDVSPPFRYQLYILPICKLQMAIYDYMFGFAKF